MTLAGTMGTVGYVWVLRNEHTLEIIGVYESQEAAIEANTTINKHDCGIALSIMQFNLIGIRIWG